MTESTIIVGIDGSPAADQALAWARALGARTGAPVRAVMTWEVPAYAVSTDPLGSAAPSPLPAVEEGARATLDAAMTRAEGGPGLITSVLLHGPAVPTLLAEAEEHDAGLVVVGTRGLGPIRRVLMGSVSARVARDASCPVAVVPPGAPVPSGPVVVGVDGSAGSVAALRWAVATTDGPIHAVHVMEYPFGPEYAVEGLVFDGHESFGREVAERTVAEAIGAGADVSIEVAGGDARDVINQVTAARRATMIVIGARGGKGLAGLGSVATSVASNADVTVVVVPVT